MPDIRPILTIRKEQMDALDRGSLEEWMVGHLNTHFPLHCQSLGLGGVRQAVRNAVEEALRRGFASRRDQAHFVDLCFLLGPDFHSNPRYGWAGRILVDSATPNPRHRMDRLYAAAIDYLRTLAAAGIP